MRRKEEKGFRLTPKRKEAIRICESMGKQFNTEIFKNPITHAMSTEDLIKFSDESLGNRSIEIQSTIPEIRQELSKEQIYQNVREKFKLMEEFVILTGLGTYNSLFISGSAGVGKTESTKQNLSNLGLDYKRISGNMTDGGLYKTLYENRFQGNILLFDDTDEILLREKSLNVLKAATDSSDIRTVDWGSSKSFFDEDGDEIPPQFEFNGTIIFISNKDLYKEAKSGSKLAPHIEALISRSVVLDVTLNSKDEYLARIHDVLFNKMDESKYSVDVKNELFGFLEEHGEKIQELSLRMIKKLYGLFMNYDTEWKQKALLAFGKKV